MSHTSPVILWFRQDLRLADNPALATAAADRVVIPVFIDDPDAAVGWAPGGASRWWLHHSLRSLGDSLTKLGSRLILRRGPAKHVLETLLAETGADTVVWNRQYEPWATARDTDIKGWLKAQGVAAQSHNAALLHEPWTIRTKDDRPYQVYSPFWRACRASGDPPRPVAAPTGLAAADPWPPSDRLDDWQLLPTKPDWAGGLRETWTPGEAGAGARLEAFLDRALTTYKDDRNRPDLDATSGLSPHLHFGEIGPRQVWHAARARMEGAGRAEAQAEHFLKELVWREFSHHLLFHFPDLPDTPLNRRFADFPWADDDRLLRAWQRGQTGYPIVDAGMRQLWHTGWMHNRVRMIVASFLVKDLLIPWQAGEAWFWDTLVDADLANNAASWQWVAGCGADAAPYFRIFNPVLQGQKFDPQGTYVRHWVPEVATLPDRWIHNPWDASDSTLAGAGVRLGQSYPRPIVDHAAARQTALAAFEAIRDRQAA